MTEDSHSEGSPLPSGLLLIGRREHVDFPEWGLAHVRAKIDTGAYSSVLDVAGHELFEADDGRRMVRIQLRTRRSERTWSESS